MLRLSSIASTRRLAKQWVDMSRDKRKELLTCLDSDSRIAVIERMIEIRKERRDER